MAMHPDIQEKLYEEIMDAIEKNDGKIDVEMASNIDYLNGVVLESMRFLPFIIYHGRNCIQDTEVRSTIIVLRIRQLSYRP